MLVNKPLKLGLIGYPIAHSFSPTFFRKKFLTESVSGCSYDLFPLKNLDDLPDLLELVNGLNVTSPYKQEVMPYLDEISPIARTIGAVNCIKIVNKKAFGYNTDYDGFKVSLLELIGGNFDGSALILGDGGAAKSVKEVLRNLGINYTIVSRKENNLNYENLTNNDILENRLIINTTPLGTHPKIDEYPLIPYEAISSKHFLYDLVYNPEKTLFLSYGEDRKAKIMNGNRMLVLQAEKSWDIWTNNQIQ